MTTSPRRVSWELVAIVALVVVLAVAAALYLASPAGRGEVVAPDHLSLEVAGAVPHGTTDGGRPYMGRPDAPVTVVEFADFQCPFCRAFVLGGMRDFIKEYVVPGTARLELVILDIDGVESTAAAKVGLCAADLGQFWPVHDWLYANQASVSNTGAFTPERLVEIGRRAGLDAAAIERCLQDDALTARVVANDEYARTYSVASTPTFLVGERVIEGGDLDALRAAVDADLRD